jgi:hypothetical protein
MTQETAHNQQRLDATENRPLPPATGGIAAADEYEATKLDTSLNNLLLICPLQHEEWDTTMGVADVLVSYILEVSYSLNTEDNSVEVDYNDLGETPVFWQRVKRQLDAQASPESPWVVGKLVKPGRAYQLQAPTAEDLRAANVALEMFRSETEEPF